MMFFNFDFYITTLHFVASSKVVRILMPELMNLCKSLCPKCYIDIISLSMDSLVSIYARNLQ